MRNDVDNIELQAKCLNKILKESIESLKRKDIYNKLCYLLCISDKKITSKIERINVIYRTIDLAISMGNYKKALKYCCYLKKSVEEVINQIQEYVINC